ncbi:kelch repeat-containing protein [Dinghuibacter silviterrae]|nr:kelch repeat-containing protein [Dinghuibacter silviterrae]
MKTPLLLLLPVLLGAKATAQTTNEWVWINGDNTLNVAGVYGTLGVAATTNKPGGRYNPSSWTDGNGHFWMFGGWGYDAAGAPGFLNDFWEYDSATNRWTWMGGTNGIGAAATYGTKNVGSTANIPGARYGANTWVDASGNLWLFGGGYGTTAGSAAVSIWYNDLWKYNPTAGTWTWVSGSNTSSQNGTYGTKGTAATTNVPGGRFESTTWIDLSGNLWLFGGGGMPATGANGYLNDLWKFNPTAGTWTWMSGSNAAASAGVYGTKGTAAAANTPGARYGGSSIVDNGGNLWMFGGGTGTTAAVLNLFFNDLWEFNISTGQWTWVSGDNTTNSNGVYGTEYVAAAANKPGGRVAVANWKQTINGNIVIFGGVGLGATGGSGYLEDMWAYDITTGLWAWQDGATSTAVDGVYGTLGVGAIANNPGGRYSPGAWVDRHGDLWLFGGHGYPATGTTSGYLDDLWEFVPIIILPVDWLGVQATPAPSDILVTWQMALPGGNGWFNVERSTDAINWQTIGTVDGSSGNGNNYGFTDKTPVPGVNYYRLQLYTTEKTSNGYSNVVTATFQATRTLVSYFLGKGYLGIRLQNGSTEHYRLIDMTGRMATQGNLKNGASTLGPLVPGVYVLQVAGQTGIITQKVAVP